MSFETVRKVATPPQVGFGNHLIVIQEEGYVLMKTHRPLCCVFHTITLIIIYVALEFPGVVTILGEHEYFHPILCLSTWMKRRWSRK